MRTPTRTAVAGSMLGLALLAGAACSSGPPEPPPCENPVTGTMVVMDDFSYDPGCLAAGAGTTIEVDNQGAAPHTFTLEGTETDLDLPAGERGSVTLGDLTPGTYTVTCTYHPQMLAALEVPS